MKNTVVRLYGKCINSWKHVEERKGRQCESTIQMEYEYKDYYLDGSLSSIGSEDFSPERYEKEFVICQVCVWDGKKRNKGGHRWFDYMGVVRFPRYQRKDIREYLKQQYSKFEVVQLRTI